MMLTTILNSLSRQRFLRMEMSPTLRWMYLVIVIFNSQNKTTRLTLENPPSKTTCKKSFVFGIGKSLILILYPMIHRNALEARLHLLTGNLFFDHFLESANAEGLGQSKIPNPIAALTAEFLEPVLKIQRWYLLAVRSSFNIFVWKDPYLSFWILVTLCALMVFLILFPWRLFFLVSSVIIFGPQVRNYY